MPEVPRRHFEAHVSYTAFRDRLADYMDQVWDSREPLHVTRQGGRPVVVMSEEEFSGLMETVHLLRSPANVRRLLEALRAAEAGELVEHPLVEP